MLAVGFVLLFFLRLFAFPGRKINMNLVLKGEVRNLTNIVNSWIMVHCKYRKEEEVKKTNR